MIEKPEVVYKDHDDRTSNIDELTTMLNVRRCVFQLLFAVNEMTNNLGGLNQAVPESPVRDLAEDHKTMDNPKDNKPLRDGDVIVGGPGYLVLYSQETDWRGWSVYDLKPERPIINILDLAAAVQRGEVVVCLTKQEIRDLLDGYTANAKLRKAWEAMK